MNDDGLRAEYASRYQDFLVPLADALKGHLQECLSGIRRIDQISTRAKSPERFAVKAAKLRTDGSKKYERPLEEIQDQIGARIVVFYSDDVEAVEIEFEKYFRRIEKQDLVPESDHEFGYVGKHYVCPIPIDVVGASVDEDRIPQFFELQIKTLFQHAWSEAEHDLGYKPDVPLTSLQARKMAFTAAQAWGADQIFNELHRELLAQPRHKGEIGARIAHSPTGNSAQCIDQA